MDIKTRKNDRFLEVIFVDGNTIIDLGLLDRKERISLARILKEAVDDLIEGIDES